MKKLFRINLPGIFALGLMVAGIMYVRAQGGGPIGECPETNGSETVLLPDGSCCNIFYKCEWGKVVKLECPDGLHFNERLAVCDWPHDAGCSKGGEEGTNCSGNGSRTCYNQNVFTYDAPYLLNCGTCKEKQSLGQPVGKCP